MKKKTIALLTAVVLSIVILLAGTYAWFTDTDEVDNEFELANLGAKITEVYEPRTVIPGLAIRKDVTVANTHSNIPILVRVSLYEALQMLETQAGSPRIFWNDAPGLPAPVPPSTETDHVILPANTAFVSAVGSDWEELDLTGVALTNAPPVLANLHIWRRTANQPDATTKYTYFAYYTDADGKNQLAQLENIVQKAVDPGKGDLVSATVTYATNRQGDKVEKGPLEFDSSGKVNPPATGTIIHENDGLKLVFGSLVVHDAPHAGRWYYNADDAHFYYVGLLAVGAETPALITAVEFGNTLDNRFQGAIYTLTPKLQALQPTTEAMESEWGLTSGDLYDVLKVLCDAYMATMP